ncbi:MAG: hypothetical protein GF411_10805 [Candidatus Lokiarchaeota archaeon]|nr:hypothetical protein [Candidatus Lokiarchaeota archaeon]
MLYDAPGDGSYTFKQGVQSFTEGAFIAGSLVAAPYLGPGGVLGMSSMIMSVGTGNFQMGPFSYNMPSDQWAFGWGPVDYNMTSKEWDYLFEEGNTLGQNIQYGLRTASDLLNVYEKVSSFRQMSQSLSGLEEQGIQLVSYNGGKEKSGNRLLADLWWHFQYGGGEDYYLHVNRLDFSNATQRNLELTQLGLYDIKGDVDLFNLGVNPTSLALGKVSMQRYGSNTFGIMPDVFDFDYKPWRGNFKRNIGNTIGAIACYTPLGIRTPLRHGGPFKINFGGLLYIPY